MTDAERRGKRGAGLAALKAWEEEHKHDTVYMGGPLGPPGAHPQDGVADLANELLVVRAPSHEAAGKLFEGHPHSTIFPCDCVDVVPLLSRTPDA